MYVCMSRNKNCKYGKRNIYKIQEREGTPGAPNADAELLKKIKIKIKLREITPTRANLPYAALSTISTSGDFDDDGSSGRHVRPEKASKRHRS